MASATFTTVNSKGTIQAYPFPPPQISSQYQAQLLQNDSDLTLWQTTKQNARVILTTVGTAVGAVAASIPILNGTVPVLPESVVTWGGKAVELLWETGGWTWNLLPSSAKAALVAGAVFLTWNSWKGKQNGAATVHIHNHIYNSPSQPDRLFSTSSLSAENELVYLVIPKKTWDQWVESHPDLLESQEPKILLLNGSSEKA